MNNIPAGLILETVALANGLTSDDLIGRSRYAHIALARHIAMWMVRRRCGLSYPALARLFGNRDHTTALSAVHKISRLLLTDRDFGARIEAIELALGWPGLHVTRAEQIAGIQSEAS